MTNEDEETTVIWDFDGTIAPRWEFAPPLAEMTSDTLNPAYWQYRQTPNTNHLFITGRGEDECHALANLVNLPRDKVICRPFPVGDELTYMRRYREWKAQEIVDHALAAPGPVVIFDDDRGVLRLVKKQIPRGKEIHLVRVDFGPPLPWRTRVRNFFRRI